MKEHTTDSQCSAILEHLKKGLSITPLERYTGDTYYGTIRMAIATAPFTTREEDIKAEIEQRLPRLKRQKYTIKIL